MEILDRPIGVQMCIKCEPIEFKQVSHREVSIKHLRKVQETKEYIRRNGETVIKVEWFIDSTDGIKTYVGYVTFEYFDGHQMQTDFIQVMTVV